MDPKLQWVPWESFKKADLRPLLLDSESVDLGKSQESAFLNLPELRTLLCQPPPHNTASMTVTHQAQTGQLDFSSENIVLLKPALCCWLGYPNPVDCFVLLTVMAHYTVDVPFHPSLHIALSNKVSVLVGTFFIANNKNAIKTNFNKRGEFSGPLN